MKEIFDNIFKEGNRIYTKNLVPGRKVYGERLHGELREWNPERSKLGAAVIKKMKSMPIKKDSVVLYLGASTGTTVSHVSDIAENGIIYAVEFSERVGRKLVELAEQRKNIAPLFADARKPEQYEWVEDADVLFCDISQPEETEIAIRNAFSFLKKDGFLMLSVKSQSIDVTKQSEKVYEEEKDKLKKAGFKILELVNLEPYEKNHAMIIARK